MARRVRGPQNAVRLKVTLKGMRPPVWRRLLVGDAMTLDDLHMAVQAAMGWDNAHLHLFVVGRKTYADPSMLDDTADEAGLTLGALAAAGVKSLAYIYDMGDSWEHAVAIEGSEPIEPGRGYPACIGGRRACPPEDSGGVWGFGAMLEALADPAHPEHAERKEWIGDFDAEAFSVAAADARLGEWFGRRKGRGRRTDAPRRGGGGL